MQIQNNCWSIESSSGGVVQNTLFRLQKALLLSKLRYRTIVKNKEHQIKYFKYKHLLSNFRYVATKSLKKYANNLGMFSFIAKQ